MSVWAAITKYRPGWPKQQVLTARSSGGWRAEIGVPARTGEALFWVRGFSCPRLAAGDGSSLEPLKDPDPIGEGFTLITYLPKAPPPNPNTFGG